MMGKVKKVTSNHLFLPLFALALLLVFNAFATPVRSDAAGQRNDGRL